MNGAAACDDGALHPLSREARAREIEDELRFHLDALTREYQDQGYARAAAERAARARFGDPDGVRRQCLVVARRGEWFMRTVLVVLVVLLLAASALSVLRARQAQAESLRARQMAMAARERAMSAAQAAAAPDAERQLLTVDEVLANAAQQVESELRDQPELAARLRAIILGANRERR
ncbi:MAG: permease prefix domain 1-containing protein [Planctomycetota bacterium]